jgi:hypothetical protein
VAQEELPALRQAATDEKGAAAPILTGLSGHGPIPWRTILEDRELAPEVTWPRSVPTYTAMQTDAQIKGLLMSTTLPIRRFRWDLEPNGAKPEVVAHISESLNLPIAGQEPQRKNRVRGRFSFDRHLAHALRALAYGHYYFEQIYEYRDPRDGGDGLLHLKKLGTRPPRTIVNFLLERNGDLEGIEQTAAVQSAALTTPLTAIRLERSRLLPYVWEPEDDADWIGRSALRACLGNWAIKSRLIRVDAVKHERNAMGIPWFEAGPDTADESIKELAKIALEIRAGEYSGGAGPGRLRIAGVEGTLPDTIASIRYHDQQMSRALMQLFFDLGTTETGSRALATELLDWYVESQDAIADWFADTIQAEQIEDEVELNWGPDEQPPRIVYTRLETENLALSDLINAVEAGLVEVDDEIRSALAQRWGLPPPPKAVAAT